eukprot:833152-Amphidinium_carterae.1
MSQEKPPHLRTTRGGGHKASNKYEGGKSSDCETERLKRKRIKMEGVGVKIAGEEVERCVEVDSGVDSSLDGSDMKLVDSGVNVDRGGMTVVRLRHVTHDE